MKIYMTEREKYNAILKEIKEIHGKGPSDSDWNRIG